MGKKKQRKKAKRRLDKWTKDLDFDDVVLAGIGVLVDAAKRNKKKRFKQARRSGMAALDKGWKSIEQLVLADDDPTGSDEPVISYEHQGGGWYSVDVNGLAVARIQGEEAAAEHAGSLLEAYAALDADKQAAGQTGLLHTGGGWYEIHVDGVPVERIRGKEAATARHDEILALT